MSSGGVSSRVSVLAAAVLAATLLACGEQEVEPWPHAPSPCVDVDPPCECPEDAVDECWEPCRIEGEECRWPGGGTKYCREGVWHCVAP